MNGREGRAAAFTDDFGLDLLAAGRGRWGSCPLSDLSYDTMLHELGAALEPAARRLAANPADGAGLRAFGRWYAYRRVWDRAAELLERARSAGADVPPAELARSLWMSGDAPGAVAAFDRAIIAARDEAEREYLALCGRAAALSDPRLDAAARATAAAYPAVAAAAAPFLSARRAPATAYQYTAHPYFLLGQVCLSAGEEAQADRLFLAAGNMIGGGSPPAVVAALLSRARAGLDSQQAYSWAEQGVNLVEAERLAKRAVAAEPGDGGILDTLGWVYYKTGRFPLAADWLGKGAAKSGEQAKVQWDHLGDALWRAGRQEEAVRAWRRAATAGDAAGGGAVPRAAAKLTAMERGQRPAVAPTASEPMTEGSHVVDPATRPATNSGIGPGTRPTTESTIPPFP